MLNSGMILWHDVQLTMCRSTIKQKYSWNKITNVIVLFQLCFSFVSHVTAAYNVVDVLSARRNRLNDVTVTASGPSRSNNVKLSCLFYSYYVVCFLFTAYAW